MPQKGELSASPNDTQKELACMGTENVTLELIAPCSTKYDKIGQTDTEQRTGGCKNVQ